MQAPSWVVLAHLLRPQGRKGEILAELLTDFPERFSGRPRVFLAAPAFTGSLDQARQVEIASSWLPVGRNKGRIVLQFDGIDTISATEPLLGLDVVIPSEERRLLHDGSVYISDLVGCAVYDGQAQVGTIEDVRFPTTADGSARLEEAAPLLAVRPERGGEILIPFVNEFIVHADLAARRIEMKLPPGLVEINRDDSGQADA